MALLPNGQQPQQELCPPSISGWCFLTGTLQEASQGWGLLPCLQPLSAGLWAGLHGKQYCRAWQLMAALTWKALCCWQDAQLLLAVTTFDTLFSWLQCCLPSPLFFLSLPLSPCFSFGMFTLVYSLLPTASFAFNKAQGPLLLSFWIPDPASDLVLKYSCPTL